MEKWAVAAVVIFAYSVVMIAIGLSAHRRAKKRKLETAGEYFLMGKNIGPFLLFWTMLASLQSTFAFLGAAGKYYVEGIGFMILPLSQGLIISFLTLTIGYRLCILTKERNYLTPTDFLADRFHSRNLRFLAGFVEAFFLLFFLAMQFVGSAHAITGITEGHIPYAEALVLIIVVTGIYTAFGGMRAVVWTDFIQGVLLLAMSLTAAIFIADHFGGVPAIFKAMAQVNPASLSIPGAANVYTDITWITQFLVLPFGMWFCPHILIRTMAARDKRSLLAGTLAIPVSQIWLYLIAGPILGFAGYLEFGPGLKAPDEVIPLLMTRYVPIILGSLVMSGAIAAAMSTIDSMMLSVSQIVTKDFVMQFGKISQKTILRIGKVLMLVIVMISFFVAYRPPLLLINVIISVTYTAMAQLAPAFILGVYWKRANRYGIGSGLAVGLIILLTTNALKISPIGIPGFLWAFAANWVLCIVVSLLASPRAVHG